MAASIYSESNMRVPEISIIVPVYNVDKYLDKMLGSLRTQSFADFEVIIINDGSTDGSAEIIERYCHEDERFHGYWQKNQGVAAARNTGLTYAQGKYIAFYDSDDIVPTDALKNLYQTAEKKEADLVIGVTEIVEGFQSRISLPSKRLALVKNIGKYTYNLVWSFGLWNKLYRRSVMVEHNLRFDDLTFSEDAVFVFRYIFACEKIAGCNAVVYQYRLRDFWENPSITQKTRKKSLCDAVQAYEILRELVTKAIEEDEKNLIDNNDVTDLQVEREKQIHANFRQKLFTRIINFNLLNNFYRRIWRSEEDLYPIMKNAVESLKTEISQEYWQSIVAAQKDLRLERGLMTIEELTEEPLVSFAVLESISKNRAGLILQGIYNQCVPAFEVLVHESLLESLPERFQNMANLHILTENSHSAKMEALKKAKGAFLSFVEEDIFFSINNMRTMAEMLIDDPAADAVSLSVKYIKNGSIEGIPCLDFVFSRRAEDLRDTADFNRLNWMFTNKLFRVAAIKNQEITFSDDSFSDMMKLYDQLNIIKNYQEFMLTYEVDETLILQKCGRLAELYLQEQVYLKAGIKKEWSRRVSAPKVYKRSGLHGIKNNLLVLAEGRSHSGLSGGLKCIYDKLETQENLEVRIYFLDEEKYKPYRYRAFYQQAAEAKFLFYNNKRTLSNLKVREETTAVYIPLEADFDLFQEADDMGQTVRKELERQFPQVRRKKLAFYCGTQIFSAEELKALRKIMRRSNMILMIWHIPTAEEKGMSLNEREEYLIDVSAFLTVDAALSASDVLVSDRCDQLGKFIFLNRPAAVWKSIWADEDLDSMKNELMRQSPILKNTEEMGAWIESLKNEQNQAGTLLKEELFGNCKGSFTEGLLQRLNLI
ncbi:glycosyltransferase [Ihubacter massiliensis]|nr:glycosyltransferase family 2 protein [Ihubacter massiliensis]MCO7123763.1 glycosyltransferase [Ihubacter massiliensis]